MSVTEGDVETLQADRAELLALLMKARDGVATGDSPVRPRAGRGPVPLSFAQERLWVLDRLRPGGSEYNIPVLLRLGGVLDIGALERSLGEVVRRHEVLRTRIAVIDGDPVQVIATASDVSLTQLDLSRLAPAVPVEKLDERLAGFTSSSFDLANGTLFRTALLKLSEREHALVLVLHHMIFDGWSMTILKRELSALYTSFSQGDQSPLPEPILQYADYALWQRERLQGEFLDRQASYWRKQFAEAPAALELPTDRKRPATLSFRGAQLSFAMSSGLTGALEALARNQGATLFMVLLAGFQAVLSRWSGQEDIVVGSPIAGRTRRELEGLIGFFANTLPLRTKLSCSWSFRELLGRVKDMTLDAYKHQELPFEKLVAELQPVRDLSRQPVFQVLFALQNVQSVQPQFSGLRYLGSRLKAAEEWSEVPAKFDLSLYVHQEAEKLRGVFEYSTDLFDRTTIERLVSHFRTLLEGIAANPDSSISALPLLGASERHLLLDEWNATSADYPRDKCLHELFAEQAARTPGAVAVMFEERQLTYAQLDRHSNQLARHLRDLGVGPESIVGLCVERSVEMVVGLLGILKAGGAYLPLDPEYPPERLAYMLSDARAPVLVTQASLLNLLPGHDARVVQLDSDWAAIERHASSAPPNLVSPGNLAYVIYTSGSTGKPKGVMVEHRQVTNYAFGVARRLPFEGLRNLAMVQSLAVGSAITVLYPALLSGACLHVISRNRSLDADACGRYFEQHSIDGLKIAPSHLASLVAASKRPAELLPSVVVVAGEPSPSTWAVKMSSVDSDSRIFNHYGATETTIGVLTYPFSSELRTDIPSVPLGKPLPNCQVYVLDRELNPTPPGIVGEIYVAGDNLTRGYLGSAALTAEKFIPNPFGRDGTRIYCTNDLGRRFADGAIQYLGREDNQ